MSRSGGESGDESGGEPGVWGVGSGESDESGSEAAYRPTQGIAGCNAKLG